MACLRKQSWSLLFFTFFCSIYLTAAQSTCSASQPCQVGCCSKYGSCGFGADFCSASNCVGTCDAKSECDPGWGPQWSSSEKCPLDVCCSKHGFCGTTPDFCGSSTVQSPSCSGTSATQRSIGYYEGWAPTRECNNMYPEQIMTSAYTHINFAFAYVDPSSFAVAPMDQSQVGLYQRTTALKDTNPGLEVWISIGGWSMNDPWQPTHATFSQLAASQSAQNAFFSSLISFMATYGFDGVDIDWEYPVAPERSGNDADFANYVSFLQNLRAALSASGHSYGLTITIPASYWYMRNFDIVQIEPVIDWFNIMTYDLHGTWDREDKWIGSIVGAHTNLTEIDQAMQLLWRNNIDPAKVNLGLGFYGRSFTLQDPSCSAPGCPFSSGGNPGRCTGQAGILSYSEISDIIDQGATVTTDTTAAVEIVTFGGNQWVSYDSDQTFAMKLDYANSHCLGGTFVWAVSLDDGNGTAADALSKSNGLVDFHQKAVALDTESVYPGCVITDCARSPICPAGKSAVQQTTNGPKNVDIPPCPAGQQRTYCCNSNDLPTCHWNGGGIFCFGTGCADDEIELATETAGCGFGSKHLCCSKTRQQVATGNCTWSDCRQDCPSGLTKLFSTQTKPGSGFCFGGQYNYCCPNPPPWTDCQYVNDRSWLGGLACAGECDYGQVELFRTGERCLTGSEPFCCTPVVGPDDPLIAAFSSAIKAYKANPVCSANDVIIPGIPLGGDINDKRDIRHNNADFENELHRKHYARSLATLGTRDVSAAGGLSFFETINIMGRGSNYYERQLQLIWDSEIGEEYHFLAADFQVYFNAYPDYDSLGLTQSIVCNIQDAQNAFNSSHSDTEVCQIDLTPQNRARDLHLSHAPNDLDVGGTYNDTLFLGLAKRIFAEDNNPPPGGGRAPNSMPYSGTLLRALTGNYDGRVPLLYMRQINFRREDREMILEAAWDIRGYPGLQYSPDDTMAIIHFHVLGLERSGAPRISRFHVFHAQAFYETYPNTGDYRAYGFDRAEFAEQHPTPVLDCPFVQGERSYWVPGDSNRPPPDGPGAILIEQFGRAMLQQGVLNQNVFAPALDRIPPGSYWATWNFELGLWSFYPYGTQVVESSNFGLYGFGSGQPVDFPNSGIPRWQRPQ